jgi:hypothetical protein
MPPVFFDSSKPTGGKTAGATKAGAPAPHSETWSGQFRLRRELPISQEW